MQDSYYYYYHPYHPHHKHYPYNPYITYSPKTNREALLKYTYVMLCLTLSFWLVSMYIHTYIE